MNNMAKKMGGTYSAPKLNYGPSPSDPTRATLSPSAPPDQSIYSNPITANQYTQRSPSTSQVGAGPSGRLSSPNSLPQSNFDNPLKDGN